MTLGKPFCRSGDVSSASDAAKDAVVDAAAVAAAADVRSRDVRTSRLRRTHVLLFAGVVFDTLSHTKTLFDPNTISYFLVHCFFCLRSFSLSYVHCLCLVLSHMCTMTFSFSYEHCPCIFLSHMYLLFTMSFSLYFVHYAFTLFSLYDYNLFSPPCPVYLFH